MNDIFISYASEDRARIVPLAANLEKRGWSVFWDVAILPGDDWRSRILKSLADAECVIVIWSLHSVKSRWVLEEAEEAVNQKKRIIPLRIDDVEPPIGFRSIQVASFIEWNGTPEAIEFRRLEHALRAFLRPASQAPEVFPQPPSARGWRRLTSTRMRLVVGLVAGIIVFIAFLQSFRSSGLRANDDYFSNPYGRVALDVLENDRLPDSKYVRVLDLSTPAHGTAMVAPDGRRITYQARPGHVGDDAFSYTVGSDADRQDARILVKSEVLRPTLTNSIGIEFVLVPAGTFEMGSEDGDADERPVHKVTISRPFYLGRYEITQGQWARVMGRSIDEQENVRRAGLGLAGSGPEYPMYWVSWNEAKAFAKALNDAEGCLDCYRLPTEAEWEYAAKTGSQGGGGNTPKATWSKVEQNTPSQAAPIGSRRPNALGIYDLHGNVWEWVADHSERNPKYDPASSMDPLNETDAPFRIIRGGSWQSMLHETRAENRGVHNANAAARDLGFRLVRRAY